jgi:hypothetical protein
MWTTVTVGSDRTGVSLRSFQRPDTLDSVPDARTLGDPTPVLAMPAGGEAEVVAFCEGILCIPHVPELDHLAARGGCWFEDGDLEIHLGVDADFRPATKAHAAFIVDDVRSLAAAVVAAGLVVNATSHRPAHDRVYVSDPFGDRIELMQLDSCRAGRRPAPHEPAPERHVAAPPPSAAATSPSIRA